MISSLDSGSEKFLADLRRIGATMERAQRSISSGLRVRLPSDSPNDVPAILSERANLEQTLQTKMNLARTKAEVDTAEQALQSAVKVLQRALQLGVQGATSTQTGDERRTIAVEVRAIHEQLVSIARTQVGDRYVFSGDADQSEPYRIDLSQQDGVGSYLGMPATRQALHPAGSRFSVSRTAKDIFASDAPGENVFRAVNELRIALEQDNAADIETALQSIRSAQARLNTDLSFYGTVQNQVDEAIQFANKLELRQRTGLSELQDADITEAILQFNQAQTQQQTALAARARLPRSSLFELLG
jgi:flagellar hook-associated protein 3 FlgL